MATTSDGPALTLKPDTLCYACIAQLQERLAQLPEYRLALQDLRAKSLVPQGGGAKVSGSTEPSVPINLHILDLINDIDCVLAQVGGETVQVSDLVRSRPKPLEGVVLALQINRVWKRAEAQLGFTRTWHRRHVPCPRCNLQTLGSFSGSDSIQCSNCGGVMSRNEYDRICTIKSEK